MSEVKVMLKTGGHCIQSAAKVMLQKISEELLAATDDIDNTELSEQFALIEEFLKSADFNGLRASDERLAGIAEGTFILARDKEGKPVIEEAATERCADEN